MYKRQAENLRFLGEGSSAQGKPGAKARPQGVVLSLIHIFDAIHDTVHEMARDEARHGKAFEGLLKRYFG